MCSGLNSMKCSKASVMKAITKLSRVSCKNRVATTKMRIVRVARPGLSAKESGSKLSSRFWYCYSMALIGAQPVRSMTSSSLVWASRTKSGMAIMAKATKKMSITGKISTIAWTVTAVKKAVLS